MKFLLAFYKNIFCDPSLEFFDETVVMSCQNVCFHGAIKKIIPAFSFFLSGPLAIRTTGRQWSGPDAAEFHMLSLKDADYPETTNAIDTNKCR